jgi:hypothetical protein
VSQEKKTPDPIIIQKGNTVCEIHAKAILSKQAIEKFNNESTYIKLVKKTEN